MTTDTHKMRISRRFLVWANLFATATMTFAIVFAYRALPPEEVALFGLGWFFPGYSFILPMWLLVPFLAILGGCGTIIASLLDHKNQTLKPTATRNADWATVCYLLIRIPSAAALGVVAAYFSGKTNLDLFSDRVATMSSAAFSAAYLSNVSQLLKR